MNDCTEYGPKIPGEAGNYNWVIRFDMSHPEGYLGIIQYDDHGKVKDRVLLSPRQVRALRTFVAEHNPKRVTR